MAIKAYIEKPDTQQHRRTAQGASPNTRVRNKRKPRKKKSRGQGG